MATSAISRVSSLTKPAMRRWKGDIVSFPTVPGAYLSTPVPFTNPNERGEWPRLWYTAQHLQHHRAVGSSGFSIMMPNSSLSLCSISRQCHADW